MYFLDRRVQRSCSSNRNRLTEETIVRHLQPLVEIQKELSDNIKRLNSKISNLSLNQPENNVMFNVGSHWIILAVVLTFQVFLQWFFRWIICFNYKYQYLLMHCAPIYWLCMFDNHCKNMFGKFFLYLGPNYLYFVLASPYLFWSFHYSETCLKKPFDNQM